MPALAKATKTAPVIRKAGRETSEALAHDIRNLITTLELFSELLAEPGVLAAGKEYFAFELKTVVTASSRLIQHIAFRPEQEAVLKSRGETLEERPNISDLATSVRHLYGPLSALAGTAIDFELECLPCPGDVPISEESLTRILINLTRNAAEAMPQGGRIRVTLQQGGGGSFFKAHKAAKPALRTALLCVQDSGPGIPAELIERIFDEGFSTKACSIARRRGLGLSAVRRLAEGAGGCARVFSAPGCGARFEVELPLIPAAQENRMFSADFAERTLLEC
ncbi:MAG TPA: sensor histidine kinase [Pseudacidobacterium sp.]|jgi:signal transduction histidine kinase|nr:sensor histidine kinase [Pseudacidobacterium sp.]